MKIQNLMERACLRANTHRQAKAITPGASLKRSASDEDVMWYIIESKVLEGEKILLVMNKKYLKQARREHPDKAIYFPPEIRELARHEGCDKFEDLVRKVHMVKKEFRAWIVPIQK